MGTKLTKAQLAALQTFGRPFEDGLKAIPTSMTAAQIWLRTEPRCHYPTMRRTLDALEAKGMVIGGFGAVDYFYKVTRAGREVLREASHGH